MLTMHSLKADALTDKNGPSIMLTQTADGYSDEADTILIHPWQLRAVCEQFGIIASDLQAAKTIATLQRRMKGLQERIESLADWIMRHSDHRHADLSYEMTQLDALRDLANEWCADFDVETEPMVEANSSPAECTSAQAAML